MRKHSAVLLRRPQGIDAVLEAITGRGDSGDIAWCIRFNSFRKPLKSLKKRTYFLRIRKYRSNKINALASVTALEKSKTYKT